MELVSLLVFAGVLLAFCVFAFRAAAKLKAEFPRWAEELGWSAKPMTGWTSVPEATGAYAGRRGRAYAYLTGSGKSRISWVAMSLACDGGSRLELHLARQSFGTKMASWFGAKEVEVGDPAFDAAWFIRTNRPDYIKAALLPEFRQRIGELAAHGGRGMKLEIKVGEAIYSEQGSFGHAASRARAAAALPVLADLAALAEVEAGGGTTS